MGGSILQYIYGLELQKYFNMISYLICTRAHARYIHISEIPIHKYTVKCSHDYFKTLFFEIGPQLKKFARSSFFLFIKKRNREMTISAIPVYIKPLHLF